MGLPSFACCARGFAHRDRGRDGGCSPPPAARPSKLVATTRFDRGCVSARASSAEPEALAGPLNHRGAEVTRRDLRAQWKRTKIFASGLQQGPGSRVVRAGIQRFGADERSGARHHALWCSVTLRKDADAMRYYLNVVRDKVLLKDPDGGDFPDIYAALLEAEQSARALMANE